MPGPVHCIAESHSGTLLAIGSGNVVQLIKQGTFGLFLLFHYLPFRLRGTKVTDSPADSHLGYRLLTPRLT